MQRWYRSLYIITVFLVYESCNVRFFYVFAQDEKRAAYVLEENMSEKRKNELKKLKKKFGFKLSGENSASVTNPEYKDRAQIRRQTVGSHSDSFKTEVSCVTQYDFFFQDLIYIVHHLVILF